MSKPLKTLIFGLELHFFSFQLKAPSVVHSNTASRYDALTDMMKEGKVGPVVHKHQQIQ